MTAVRRVAIVVAPGFAGELTEIADDRHVWALRLPEYERVAHERWSAGRAGDLESGITLFNSSGASPEAELVDMFSTIEEHHGEYGHVPAVAEIEVLGARPTSEVRAELAEYDFHGVAPSRRGFTARRTL